MQTALKLIAVVITLGLVMSTGAHAVSWSPAQEEREEKAVKGIKGKGEIACLFQSGTADVKKEMRVHDLLVVYREDQNHQLRKIGKIRILSYVGEDFLKGEVVEGEVQAGDVAKKGAVASLVIAPSDTCTQNRMP